MGEEDYLVPLELRGITFPIVFAYHHLLGEGVAARFNPSTESYGADTIFVPLSQRERAAAALEQMVADFAQQEAEEARQRGSLSLTEPDDEGGALSLAEGDGALSLGEGDAP